MRARRDRRGIPTPSSDIKSAGGTEPSGPVASRDGATIGIDPPVIETRPEADLPVAPAAPIDDAVQPLPRTNWPAIISLGIGVLVVVGLVILIVLSV